MRESLSDQTIRQFMGRLTVLSSILGPENNPLSLLTTLASLQGLTWVASCLHDDPVSTLQALAESCAPLNMLRNCCLLNTESGQGKLLKQLLADSLILTLGVTVCGLGVSLHQFEARHSDAEVFWPQDLANRLCDMNEKISIEFPMIAMTIGSLTTLAIGLTQQHYARGSAISWLMATVMATMALSIAVHHLLKYIRHQVHQLKLDGEGLSVGDDGLFSPSLPFTFSALFPVLFVGFKVSPPYQMLMENYPCQSQLLIALGVLLTCTASILSVMAPFPCGRQCLSNVIEGVVQEILIATQALYILGSHKLYEKRDAVINQLSGCCTRRSAPVLFSEGPRGEIMMTRQQAMSVEDFKKLSAVVLHSYEHQYKL